jgi:hypothetical protein
MTDIPGADLVTSVFGYWPSFHDAEVVRIGLERTTDFGSGPSLTADVHAFEMTSEVDPRGYYVLRHHVLVSFRFDGVQQLQISNFNNQNAILGLGILDIRSRQLEGLHYEVGFDAAHGADVSFLCRSATVTGVRPWNAETGAPAA